MPEKKNSHRSNRFSNPVSYKTILANTELSNFISKDES